MRLASKYLSKLVSVYYWFERLDTIYEIDKVRYYR